MKGKSDRKSDCIMEDLDMKSVPHYQTNSYQLKGPYQPFCMFEPNTFSFHTCYVTDNHFPKDKTVFQLS
ncbi:hypothetical protein LDENG_00220490 [Lucifuga dentata]|nr:hypothetical protein LDENG_00220490 [Lucifuga dentata]